MPAVLRAFGGTTSAYAENTQIASPIAQVSWNYLRVRGEYLAPSHGQLATAELPPRTRRIRIAPGDVATGQGTTSAYAENTGAGASSMLPSWNYLRVRGEYKVNAGF